MHENKNQKKLSIWAVFMQWFSVKIVFLKTLQNARENTCTRVSFSIKLQAEACYLIKKRNSDTGAVMCILRNF